MSAKNGGRLMPAALESQRRVQFETSEQADLSSG